MIMDCKLPSKRFSLVCTVHTRIINFILSSNYLTIETKILKMLSRFLSISIDIQIMIINYITQPRDLKALCLVSKNISALAAPILYYQVDLTRRIDKR